MTTPEELKEWAQVKFSDFIQSEAQGVNIFPLENRRFGRLDRSDRTVDIDTQIRHLLAGACEVVCPDLPVLARCKTGFGFSVKLSVGRLRAHGGLQPQPTRVWFETKDDFLHFIGQTRYWELLNLDISAIGKAGAVFAEWAIKNPLVIKNKLRRGEGADLSAALLALHSKPRPMCFAREIALEGVSGKFIESNLGLLARILQEVGSPAWAAGPSEHDQLGLSETSRLLRLMILDGDKADYGLPLDRFFNLPVGCSQILIVENLRTFLTLPALPNTLGIFGEGYAVLTLKTHKIWLSKVPIFYWGDLDPIGFKILDLLRVDYPEIKSVMMDFCTLEQNRKLLSSADNSAQANFKTFSEDELKAYSEVQQIAQGIEQEKIPPLFAYNYLTKISAFCPPSPD